MTSVKDILERALAAHARLPVSAASVLFGSAARLAAKRRRPVWPQVMFIDTDGTLFAESSSESRIPSIYIAPELRGGKTAATDSDASIVYSIGTLGFELVTTSFLHDLERDIPVGRVIDRAMRVAAEERYSSLAEFLADLDSVAPSRPQIEERDILASLVAGHLAEPQGPATLNRWTAGKHPAAKAVERQQDPLGMTHPLPSSVVSAASTPGQHQRETAEAGDSAANGANWWKGGAAARTDEKTIPPVASAESAQEGKAAAGASEEDPIPGPEIVEPFAAFDHIIPADLRHAVPASPEGEAAADLRRDLSSQFAHYAVAMDAALQRIREQSEDLHQAVEAERERRETLAQQVSELTAVLAKTNEQPAVDSESAERLRVLDEEVRSEREHREALAAQIEGVATIVRKVEARPVSDPQAAERLESLYETVRSESEHREALARQFADVAEIVRDLNARPATDPEAVERMHLLSEGLRAEVERREVLSQDLAGVAATARELAARPLADPQTADRIRTLEESVRSERKQRESVASQIEGLSVSMQGASDTLRRVDEGLRKEREQRESLAQQVAEAAKAAPVAAERLRFLEEGLRGERQQRDALARQLSGISAIIQADVKGKIDERAAALDSALHALGEWRNDLLQSFRQEREQREAQWNEFSAVASLAGETIERLKVLDENLHAELERREALGAQVEKLAAVTREQNAAWSRRMEQLQDSASDTAAAVKRAGEDFRIEREQRETLMRQVDTLATTAPETADKLALLVEGLRAERDQREALAQHVAELATAADTSPKPSLPDPVLIERLAHLEEDVRSERERREALAKQLADISAARTDVSEPFTRRAPARDSETENLREERDGLRTTISKLDDSLRMFALTASVRQQAVPVPPPSQAPTSSIPMFAAGVATATALVALVLFLRQPPPSPAPVLVTKAAEPAPVQAPPPVQVAVVPARIPDPIAAHSNDDLALPVTTPTPIAPAPALAPPSSTAAPHPAPIAKPAKSADAKPAHPPPAPGGGEKIVKFGEEALRSGRTDAALAAFTAALKANPQLAVAHRGMAMVLVKQGKKPEARHEYESYLQLAPQAADAGRIREILSQM